ncbi:MAG: isoprenylcysteine carboxylmethyltransferase family protein [Candidatus Omnitrophica bacterium]|nr:isoprenylcysteine carboxylmethyltransferase family protein [Candidatus Omnitrophota bacterium]
MNADINSDGFRVGVPIAIIGELIRLWASGYLEKKGRLFACGGPFAFVRNPLYVGNFLVGLGVAFVIGRIWILALYVIGFIVLYAGTVRSEEEELTERFGAPYRKYLKEVPRFIPRLTPYADRQKTSFKWKLILKHREYVTIIFLVVLFLGLHLWQALFVLGEPMTQHVPALIIEAIFLSLAVVEKVFRKKIDKLVQ